MEIDPFGISFWVGVELSLCFLLGSFGLELLEVGRVHLLDQGPDILILFDGSSPLSLSSTSLGGCGNLWQVG